MQGPVSVELETVRPVDIKPVYKAEKICSLSLKALAIGRQRSPKKGKPVYFCQVMVLNSLNYKLFFYERCKSHN